MPDDRFFVSESFSAKSKTTLKDQELHHLLHVMRVQVGETIELINGKGQLAKATLEKVEKQQAHLAITEVISEDPPPYSLILAQALPRLPRLEYILEKAAELGATEIWLFPGEYSERKELSPSQLQRLQQILISAVKQCGRLYLPKLVLKPHLFAWQPLNLPAYFGDTTLKARPLLPILDKEPLSSCLWLVGPEKGLSTKEEAFLLKFLKAQGVSLHTNILRVDTAAIAGLALLSSFIQLPASANN